MIKDRGSKKLVSFIMPEHREALEQFFAEEIREHPELDEQRTEELNLILMQAYRAGRQVVIRYWDDGEREVAGRIVWFEMGKLRLVGEDGKVNIEADKIFEVITG